jgi:cholesterol transport system auxiliary component
MISSSLAAFGRLGAVGLLLASVGACSALRPTATLPPSLYSLDSAKIDAGAARRAPADVSVAASTLIVSPPHAAAGFDSQRIAYVREAHKLDYFAHAEWVDTPARMLAPLIVTAAESSGTFRSVVLTPTAAAGELRVDTEIVRLQQDFTSQPSRVRFTLRAYVMDSKTRRVLAWRVFDESVAAASDDPYGGVVAANRAVQTVLEQLAVFCATAAGQRQATAAKGETPARKDARR